MKKSNSFTIRNDFLKFRLLLRCIINFRLTPYLHILYNITYIISAKIIDFLYHWATLYWQCQVGTSQNLCASRKTIYDDDFAQNIVNFAYVKLSRIWIPDVGTETMLRMITSPGDLFYHL